MENCSHTVTGDYSSRSAGTAYVARTYLQIDNERKKTTHSIRRWREITPQTHTRPGYSWAEGGSCIAEVQFGPRSIGEVKFAGGSFTFNGETYHKSVGLLDGLFALLRTLFEWLNQIALV